MTKQSLIKLLTVENFGNGANTFQAHQAFIYLSLFMEIASFPFFA